VRVIIRAGGFVDSVEMIQERPDGSLFRFGPHGGFGGDEHSLDLDPAGEGERIVKIQGRFGIVVDSIEIITSKGRSTTTLGGSGGASEYIYEASMGLEIAGFIGRSGIFIDAIGVVMRGAV
jgi:hypothetical protein